MAGLNWGGTQYTTLEILQPRAAMPANHRMRYAYPGLPYVVRVACVGGVYPYQFSITSGAGAGMTIDQDSGVLSWPNPVTTCTPTIRVEDTLGSVITATWTVTVSSSGWVFVDAVNGHAWPTGMGTIANPFRTLADLFLHTGSGQRAYLRAGAYDFAGIPKLGVICDPGNMIGDEIDINPSNMADVWVAYPGDVAPSISFGGQTCATGCIIRWGGETLWIEGLNCRNGHWKFFDGSGSANGGGTFYRNEFHEYAASTSNSSFLMWNHAGPPRGYGCVIQNNYFHNEDGSVSPGGGLVVLWYDLTRSLVEGNTFASVGAAVSPKAGNDKFTIRGNLARTFTVGAAHFLSSNFDDYFVDGTDANGEICFNNLIGPFTYTDPNSDIGAMELGPTWPDDGVGRVAVYRNTINGVIGCSNFPASYGPYPFVQNVIVNAYNATVPYSFFKEVSGFPPPAWSAVQDTNNLKGVPAAGIIDATGKLQGAYRTSWLYYRGYEVPTGGGPPIGTPPTFTSATSTTFQVGVNSTFTVAAAPNVTSIVEAGALPAGVTYVDASGGAGGGTTSLIPSAYTTTWAPGVRGIPHRTTIFATINPATYGNGTIDASAGIQAAINSCPLEQVVLLMAGTFLVNDFLLINKAITLRGAGIGPTGTRLVRTEVGQEQLIIIGPSRFPRIDDSTSVNLTADAVKGAYSVTVTSATGFAPGQFVKLDEDDYTTAALQPMPARISGSLQSVLQSDRLSWPIHSPVNPLGELPIPDGLTWHSRSGRPLSETKEIASVVGTVITFTTPIHIAYTTAKTAQLTRYTGADNVFITGAGVEDLVTDGGADGNISFLCAAKSWVRNCEVKNYGNPGIDIKHGFRLEVRDSYIHDTVAPVPGGGGYALSLQQGASEVLIENNIVIYCNKPMVCRSAGAGCVVGYNYMDDALIDYDLTWQEVGLNASHMVGSHHVLFEGNRCFNYDSDETWGSAIYMTVFRNHLTGQRRSFTDTNNVRCIGLAFGSWWHAFVGNVLGQSGLMAGWVYEDPGDGTYGDASSVWGITTKAIWRLGYSTLWEQSPDLLVRARDIRDGNWDYLTNAVTWEQAPVTLPNSLYLTVKPGFFGANVWPWVDPIGATKLQTLPAYARYTAILASSDIPVPSPLAAGVGNLTGTPAAGTQGTYPITFTATNVDGSTPQAFTLTVTAATQVLSVPVAVMNMQQQGMN